MLVFQTPVGPIEGFGLILILISFIVWVIYLVAIANGVFNDNTTKICWFLIVLSLNVVGVILFLIWGRKEVKRKAV